MALAPPDGTACFVDSNILYYALVDTPPATAQCVELIERAMAGRVSLLVTVPVLSDAIHKVMISEAAQLSGRDRPGMVGYLGRHPEVIARLVQYSKAIEQLLTAPLNVLPLDTDLLRDATRLASQFGLLTNDATIIALMRRHHLTDLATNDDDFEAVPGITLWKPR